MIWNRFETNRSFTREMKSYFSFWKFTFWIFTRISYFTYDFLNPSTQSFHLLTMFSSFRVRNKEKLSHHSSLFTVCCIMWTYDKWFEIFWRRIGRLLGKWKVIFHFENSLFEYAPEYLILHTIDWTHPHNLSIN